MPKTWLEPEEIPPPLSFVEAVGGHPLVAETLARRGISDLGKARAFLDPDIYQPSPPSDLPGLTRAAERIETAIHGGETILVWGDFDVDGQTATTLLVEALYNLGARVAYRIPVRAIEGHGIQTEALGQTLEHPPFYHDSPATTVQAPVSLLLTCDTGIAEQPAIDFALQQGLDVIITDHHELPESLPQAYAIVNPHLLPGGHPLSSLPGVGVAYKLVEELYTSRGDPTAIDHYLDLVALGIVADVAELNGDTRYLLQRGLLVLRETPRLGLKTLYEIAEINPNRLDEGVIGFSIGPRLNALGRLSDANPIVDFFTTENPERARTLAQQFEGLNQRRRLLTEQVYQGALAAIQRDPSMLEYAALVLAHPGWPNGVIGIVASRLVEQYGKPVVLLNIQEDGTAGGSARSVEGIHLTQAIAAQATLLSGYGGHAGAAGLSLPVENIPDFRTRLSRTIRALGSEATLEPKLQIDATLPLVEVTLDLVDDLERLAPFGAGNPRLVLASRDLKLTSQVNIGSSQEHLRLVVEDQGGVGCEVLYWRGAGENLPQPGTRFDLAYQVGANTYRGERRLQLTWVDFRLASGQPEVIETEIPQRQVRDYRNEPNPAALLSAIRQSEEVQVWAEGEARNRLDGLDRSHLGPTKSLVIWTAPPSNGVLQAVIDLVDPESVTLFGVSPDLDRPQPFLSRLIGLVKHVISRKTGETTIKELAAAMAHTENTVQMGLVWLEAKGIFKVQEQEAREEGDESQFEGGDEMREDGSNGLVKLSEGSGVEAVNLVEITLELKAMLDEAAAYRRYFQQAEVQSLLR